MYILKEGILVRGGYRVRGQGTVWWDTFHGQTHTTINFTFTTPLVDGKNEAYLYDIGQWTPISPYCMETLQSWTGSSADVNT